VFALTVDAKTRVAKTPSEIAASAILPKFLSLFAGAMLSQVSQPILVIREGVG
jgi:hypothetical protein